MVNYIYLLILGSWFITSTSQQTCETALKDHKGTVYLNICSRGCYQYYIHTASGDFFPDSLPEDLKKDMLDVLFSGILQPDSTLLLKPDPTDQPEPLRKIRNIKISGILVTENN